MGDKQPEQKRRQNRAGKADLDQGGQIKGVLHTYAPSEEQGGYALCGIGPLPPDTSIGAAAQKSGWLTNPFSAGSGAVFHSERPALCKTLEW